MKVFEIFATMSLVDAISGPLARIRSSLGGTDDAVDSLSARLGRLATGLSKVGFAGCRLFRHHDHHDQ